jgi:hypothetical protein
MARIPETYRSSENQVLRSPAVAIPAVPIPAVPIPALAIAAVTGEAVAVKTVDRTAKR